MIRSGAILIALILGGAGANSAEPTVRGAPSPGADDSLSESGSWFHAGSGRTLAAYSEFQNSVGTLGVISSTGAVDTAGHPFFEPLGTNGRACVTCHQPADGMSISVKTVRDRWAATQGRDPLFAPIDGANCPDARAGDEESHSLLLDRGLFRIALPWPPKPESAEVREPEFSIKVVADPTGCNTHPRYGLNSDKPTISVYRRPRMAANMRFVVGVRRDLEFNVKNGMPLPRHPEAGHRVNMNLMYDGRELSLKTQAVAAAVNHLQVKSAPTPDQLQRIEDLQLQLYAAQSEHVSAGRFDARQTPKVLGPWGLVSAHASLPGDRLKTPVFQFFDEWTHDGAEAASKEQAEFRASVARGADVFMTKLFWQRDIWGLNNGGSGNPIKRSCSTCHNSQMTGGDNSPGWFDIGIANVPWADPNPDLPLFELTCRSDVDQHPYLGRVIRTHDPGRALISGRCADIGSLSIHQFRSFAARAPYFSNGSARTIAEVLEFYERRFDFKYTPQEKQDLINLFSVL